jgi:predicted RNA-binding protein with PIN domain
MSFLGLKGILIFDSNPNHARNYPTKKKLSQVEVAYSPIDMEADLYILEYLSLLKTPSRIRLVTSDRALAKEAKNLKIESIDSLDFFNLLKKAGTKKEAINKDLKPTSESKKELERLQKIFESNN